MVEAKSLSHAVYNEGVDLITDNLYMKGMEEIFCNVVNHLAERLITLSSHKYSRHSRLFKTLIKLKRMFNLGEDAVEILALLYLAKSNDDFRAICVRLNYELFNGLDRRKKISRIMVFTHIRESRLRSELSNNGILLRFNLIDILYEPCEHVVEYLDGFSSEPRQRQSVPHSPTRLLWLCMSADCHEWNLPG